MQISLSISFYFVGFIKIVGYPFCTIEVAKISGVTFEDFSDEKNDGIECLVLGAGRDLSVFRKIIQVSLDIFGANFFNRFFLMK